MKIELFQFKKNHPHSYSLWFWRDSNKRYHSKTFTVSWMRKYWKDNPEQLQYGYRDNGAKKENGDTCLDATLSIGYLQFNYINWNLQK